MELGKAKYGSGKHVFKIQDGDNVFRILPPMGKLAKAGKWNQYYRVEWGYKNTEGRTKPFQDVRRTNYQTQMVEVESAAHLFREGLKAKKTELVEALKKTPKDENLKKQVMEVNEDIKRYNLEAKYYVNAIDLTGKIGLLKLGSRAFKALKAEIDKLRKAGVDPLSIDNGRFFNFNRTNDTGNFQDTAYQVTVYKENVEVQGETFQKDKKHVIDQGIIDRLEDEAYELSGMYPEVTPEEVERMVKEGPVAVDQILGKGRDSSPAEDGAEDQESTQSASSAKTETKAEAKAETKSDAKPSAATKTEEIKAADVRTETKTDPAPTAKGDVSEDEFLRSIGALK